MVILAISGPRMVRFYRTTLFLTGLATLAPGFGNAQDIRPKLAVVETTVVPSIADHSTLEPIKSDGEGNLYVRFYQPDVGNAPIVKVKRDGSETLTYKLSAIPHDAFAEKDEWQRAFATDFSVAPSGDLYALVATGSKTYVAEFSSKGEYESLTELRGREIPDASSLSLSQLVILSNQKFFVSGIMTTKPKRTGKRCFNAIYDGSGNFQTEVFLKGDLQAPMLDDSDQQDGGIEGEVQTGTAISSDDGNLYLMRSAVPPKVFVLSASGQLLHAFSIKPPIDGSTPDTFKVNQGKIAIQFSRPVSSDKPDEIIFRIVNSTSGEVVGDYWGSPETSRWAAYTSDGLVFLSAKDHKLARVRAVLP